MKSLIRKLAQSLGLYETLGILIARIQGIFRGIAISGGNDKPFRVKDRAGRVIVIDKRHAIYLLDMVLFFDYFFTAVEADANNEVHFDAPGLKTVPGISKPVFFTSFAEGPSTLDLYQELVALKPGDIVLDVGAYCGLSSLSFAQKVGEAGHVYAFEPDRENFAALERNRETFGLTNLTTENAVVWKESGTVEFQGDGTSGASVAAILTRGNRTTVQVKSFSLPDFVAAQSIPRIDLLKIDAEGSEVAILSSSQDVLRHYRPSLIIELHPVQDVMTTEACRKILEQEGYTTRVLSQPGTNCPLMVAVPGRS